MSETQRDLAHELADVLNESGHDITWLDLLDDLGGAGLVLARAPGGENPAGGEHVEAVMEPDASNTETSTEAWDTAMDALLGSRIIQIQYGDLIEGQVYGECWDLHLEGGGMVQLGAVPIRDPDASGGRGVELRAEFFPHVEPIPVDPMPEP